uniref:Rx N-terminal domain-containing protein n=1 Tax=Fagus sylvatica TaxID=28930 RepID=A0A2N9IBE3_FAGSY
MAEIGYGIAVKVLEQLGSLTYQEVSSAWGVRSDLTKLEGTVSAIKAVLLDAEEKQASDHRLNHWLGQLNDVLHDAENVLDEFHYQVLQKEVMERYGSTSQKVSDFFSSSIPLEMAHNIKGIRERVDDIAADKDKFNLAQGLEDRKIINIHKRRDMTHSFVLPQNVIGRGDDKENIINILMNPDASRNVGVIPIIGIGGLGKTTLASKILVTTRNNSVATIMGTAPTYNLHGLSPENCLSLFEKLAFKEGEANQHRNLLEIGEEIVKKCKGVPLAVRTLADLLYSKVDEREWKFVRDNEIWNLEQEDGDILAALRLSYNQLPFHLKQCFAYCSLFPKDYEFKSIELIQFWMAHEILQPHGNKEMEDVGDLYIKQLWSRSFFQDVDMRNFMYYTFKMHDLVHDLALSIAQDGVQEVPTHLTEVGWSSDHSFPKNYTNVLSWNMHLEIQDGWMPYHLQTLVLDRCPFLTSLSLSTNHLTTLEILRIHDCGNLSLIEGEDNQNLKLSLKKLYLKRLQKVVVLPQWLQGSANTLQHLKIEDCDNFAAFPEWLPSLTSLQTLKITNCPKLSSLPEGMQHITTLRELRIEGCPELSRKCRQEDRLKIAHVPHIHLSDASVERQLSRKSFDEFRDWHNKDAFSSGIHHLFVRCHTFASRT